MPIFTSDLTSSGIIYADTITTNSNEDLTLNPAGTGSVVANARLKVNEISADDSTSVSIKSPLQLDSTLQVVGNLTVDANTLFVNSSNNRVGIGTTSPAYQVEIENTGANALLVLDRTDGAACFIEGQATRSAFGSVGATPLVLAYNSLAVISIGAGGAITVNPDGGSPFTLPTADGSANQILQTNGSGTLTFVDVPMGTLALGDSSSNAGSVPGGDALEFRSGDSITATVSGNGVTFDLNSSITVDTINTSDSSALTLATSMNVNGTLSATSKNFVIDHPTKPNHTLRYASLEGPENGVYVRGHLKNNSVIQLPDYWTKLVDPDSITVNLTACGHPQSLWVESINQNTISVVGDDNINCFYVVYGTRIDIPALEVESNGI